MTKPARPMRQQMTGQDAVWVKGPTTDNGPDPELPNYVRLELTEPSMLDLIRAGVNLSDYVEEIEASLTTQLIEMGIQPVTQVRLARSIDPVRYWLIFNTDEPAPEQFGMRRVFDLAPDPSKPEGAERVSIKVSR